MLTIWGAKQRFCDGICRRDFLKIGALGGLTLADLLRLKAHGGAQEARRQAKPAPDVKEEKYGAHERNVLDLWKGKSDKPTPLVVFIHGGGFRAGSKEHVPASLIKGCLEAGISVAAINYRLSHHAPFPAPMHDSGRALQHLRSKAKQWNLNPGKIAATGSSAGAGISLWLAFHDDRADPKSEEPVLRQSTRLSCALGFGTQTSYDPRFIQKHIGGRAHEHPALAPFWGLEADELETDKAYKIYEECAPITHLTKDDPPVYLLYSGERDDPSDKPGAGIHNQKFGLVLKEKMDKLGIACTVKTRGRRPSEPDQFDSEQLEFLTTSLK